MNSNMKMATLAALLMGCNAGAFAEGNSVMFKASVLVEDNSSCGIDVSSVDNKSSWGLKWTLTRGGKEGVLTRNTGSSDEPLFVKVKVRDGAAAKCNLGNMRFSAETPNTGSVTSGRGGFVRMRTQHDGYWAYMPVVAKLALFTDTKGADDNTTGAINLADITVKNTKSGANYTQKSQVASHVNDRVTGLPDLPHQPAYTLTNNYLADNGATALIAESASSDFTYSVSNLGEGEAVKGALIGIGSLVAENPEDENGTVKLNGVADGERVDMPFTVKVDLQ
ncbi:hypothetical protein EXT68_02940 [Pectobacterium parmentieri]|uniref:Uncharacterized protein n=1 Tax=Pectobacterium parmentieri TaxID=1905730 RepID=A0A0H3I1V6_PECPM|nr:hypothetical protein [Pectobacterium parmentieri]AFI89680.1 Hypothetical protein W5S_1588 [Pectobacterium parmentieri]MBI0472099.1 hypothetical protein [Pectobacterium parmentieri]MBI0495868.1 hypothetical protein [Pectobacterium parmentieri]MBI0556260.1 hypothetical protein [Pectobacterium parmentieri]MBI0569344.1 hypothetical protein [Pectobacterium parmentieri]